MVNLFENSHFFFFFFSIFQQYIDLKDPRWAFPELKLHKKLDFPYPPVVDLTECVKKETELQTEDKVQNDLQLKKGNTHLNEVPNDQDFILLESSPKYSQSPQQGCGTQQPGKRLLNSPAKVQEENTAANLRHDTPAVKLTHLPFLKTHVSDLNTSWCSEQFDSDISQMLLCFRQQKGNSEVPKCTSILKTTSSNMEPSLPEGHPEVLNCPTRHQINDKLSKEQSQGARSEQLQHQTECSTTKEVNYGANLNKGDTWENKQLTSSLNSSNHIQSPTFISSPQAKVPKQALVSDLEEMDLDQPEPGQRCSSHHSSSYSCKSPSSPSHMNLGNQSPTSEQMLSENTPEWYLETETYDDLRSESPASLPWHGESDGEDSRFVTDFRAVSRGDRQYVCPVALRKAMTGPPQVLVRTYFCSSHYLVLYLTSCQLQYKALLHIQYMSSFQDR